MDKACLLERVVDQVKTLKKKAIEVSKGFTIPTEADEVTVMECHGVDDVSSSRGNIIYIKASICCEDRPDLFADLTLTFNRLRLRTIRADMTSLGGRVQNAFILCYKDENASVCWSSLKESLKEELGKIVSYDMAHQNELSGKRQKLIRSNCFNMSL